MENLPYVTAALLCDRVLEEKTGTLSAIRIIDRIEFEIQPNVPTLQEKKIVPAVQITALVSLKSGPAVGKFNLNVDGEKPSGKRQHLVTLPFELKGRDHGANFTLNITIGAEEEGLHWFDVRIDDHLLSRIPVMLVRKPPQEVKTDESQKPE